MRVVYFAFLPFLTDKTRVSSLSLSLSSASLSTLTHFSTCLSPALVTSNAPSESLSAVASNRCLPFDRSDAFPVLFSIVTVSLSPSSTDRDRPTVRCRCLSLSSFLLSRVTFCRFNVSFRPSFRSSFLLLLLRLLRRRGGRGGGGAEVGPSMHTCADTADIRPERRRTRTDGHGLLDGYCRCRKWPQNKSVICPLFTARKHMAFGMGRCHEIGIRTFFVPSLKRRVIISSEFIYSQNYFVARFHPFIS